MTTLLDVRNRIADQLSRSDLSTQIDREIQLAITRYNRRVSWLHEVRGATLTTVAAQIWYDSLDISTGEGPQDTTSLTAIPVSDVQQIDYMREANLDPILQRSYRDFERLYDVTGSSGRVSYFTLYAGRIGLWPEPSGVQAITLSVVVKPQVPASATDTSIWFEQAQELIENAAAAAICRKFIQDGDRAQAFQVYEGAAWEDLVKEGNQKMATGRLKVHD